MRDDQDDIDVQRARQLEQQLIGEGQLDVDDAPDEELAAAKHMLDVIERARRRDSAASETISDVEVTTDDKSSALLDSLETSSEGPAHLGHFEIKHQLGRGGYGLVYLAHDPELNRLVALKIPRPEAVMTDELVGRFMREARAAAALSHPNIVPVFEAGRAGPICYIASQYVEGQSLAEWLERHQRPSPAEAAALVAALADGVAHAHQRGVLHRDLKPGNVLLENIGVRSQESGERKSDTGILDAVSSHPSPGSWLLNPDSSPRITDFGLAKLVEEAGAQTQTGAVLGTPAYMSPEQAQGGKVEIGPATDIYSLGAILYELLTGRPPFDEETILDTINAVREREATPTRRLNQKVPQDLDAICLKCLEKRPTDRYSTAMDLRRDLERFLADEPVLARPVTRMQRMKKWCRRNPAIAGLSAAALVLLVVALTATTVGWISTSTALDRATAANRQADLRLQDSFAAVKELLVAIAETPEIQLQGFQPLREKLLARANAFQTQFISDRPNDADLRQRHNDVLFSLARVKSDLGDYQSAGEIADELLKDLPAADGATNADLRERTRLLTFLAQQYSQLRDSSKRTYYVNATLELVHSSFSAADEDIENRISLAKALSSLAYLLASAGERTDGNRLALEAVSIWETIDASALSDVENVRAMGRSYLTAAENLAGSERNADAKQYCGRAIDIFELLNEDSERVMPESRYHLANAHRVMGFLWDKNYEPAKSAFQRAIEVASILVLDHPMIPRYHLRLVESRSNFGLSHAINKNFDEAEQLFQLNLEELSVLAVRFPNYDRLPWMNGTTLSMLQYVYGETKQPEKAIETERIARDLYMKQHEKEGTPATLLRVIMSDGNIAKGLRDLKQFDEAISVFEKTTEQFLDLIADDPENGEAKRFLANDLQGLANCLAQTGRWQEALERFQQSMPFTHLQEWELYDQESIYLTHVGRFDDARSRLDEYFASESLANKRAILSAGVMHALAQEHVGSDTEEARRLAEHAALRGVEALEAIEDESALTQLLDQPVFEAFKLTPKLQDWLRDR